MSLRRLLGAKDVNFWDADGEFLDVMTENATNEYFIV